jgi:hypothetical protein
MMAMQTPRWLLLATALTFASGLGCGGDTPSPKPGGGDDDGKSNNPASTDEGDDADKPAAAVDAGGGKKDAGSTTKPSGTDAGAGAGKDKDAGNAATGSGSDAAALGDKDGGAASPTDGSVSTGTGAGAGSCGPEVTATAAELGDTKKLGPWKPMHVEKTGPTGASWVFYPDGFGKDGLKHPVFNWGPGAGTGPSNYVDHLNLLASHGFVVISQSSTESGKTALDWILKQNETTGSMWFGKLDTDRVARGGHSMGALQSMTEAGDARLKLTVLVCGGAGGGGGAAKINYPSIFLGGKGESGTTNFVPDYGEVTGPSVFVTHSTTDHIYCARDNMGPWVAFMRWHLCGEEDKWKKEFLEGGTYGKTPWEPTKTKNL